MTRITGSRCQGGTPSQNLIPNRRGAARRAGVSLPSPVCHPHWGML